MLKYKVGRLFTRTDDRMAPQWEWLLILGILKGRAMVVFPLYIMGEIHVS